MTPPEFHLIILSQLPNGLAGFQLNTPSSAEILKRADETGQSIFSSLAISHA